MRRYSGVNELCYKETWHSSCELWSQRAAEDWYGWSNSKMDLLEKKCLDHCHSEATRSSSGIIGHKQEWKGSASRQGSVHIIRKKIMLEKTVKRK